MFGTILENENTVDLVLAEGALDKTYNAFTSSMYDLQGRAYERGFAAYVSEGAAGVTYVAEEAEKTKANWFKKMLEAIKAFAVKVKNKAIEIFNRMKAAFTKTPTDEKLASAQGAFDSAAHVDGATAWTKVKVVFDAAKALADSAVAASSWADVEKNAASSGSSDAGKNVAVFTGLVDKYNAAMSDYSKTVEGKTLYFKSVAEAKTVGSNVATELKVMSTTSDDLQKKVAELQKAIDANLSKADAEVPKSTSQKMKDEMDNAGTEADKRTVARKEVATKYYNQFISEVKTALTKTSSAMALASGIAAKIDVLFKKAEASTKERSDAAKAKSDSRMVRESFDLFGGNDSFDDFSFTL